MILVETGQTSHSMNKVILDTGILIRFLRGKSQAKELLRKLHRTSTKISISVITALELFIGCKDNTSDKADVNELLSKLNVIDVSWFIFWVYFVVLIFNQSTQRERGYLL